MSAFTLGHPCWVQNPTPRTRRERWARLRRTLWQPPRPHGEQPRERVVGPLELFYDLAVVVLVAQAAHHLAGRLTWQGLGEFAAVASHARRRGGPWTAALLAPAGGSGQRRQIDRSVDHLAGVLVHRVRGHVLGTGLVGGRVHLPDARGRRDVGTGEEDHTVVRERDRPGLADAVDREDLELLADDLRAVEVVVHRLERPGAAEGTGTAGGHRLSAGPTRCP